MRSSVFIVIISIIVFTFLIQSCEKYPTSSDNKTTGTVTDIDGNVYQTVKIGDQWWMAENLRVIWYRNGDVIPKVTDGIEWARLSTGAYCNYNNNDSNAYIYGSLYNWYSVNDSRGLAPEGWHVPSDAEWKTLASYLGGDAVAGGKMKESGTMHWANPGATNESGFSALPGGYRYANGTYDLMGYYAFYWSTTEFSSYYAWYRELRDGESEVRHYYNGKVQGYSVRCIKD